MLGEGLQRSGQSDAVMLKGSSATLPSALQPNHPSAQHCLVLKGPSPRSAKRSSEKAQIIMSSTLREK